MDGRSWTASRHLFPICASVQPLFRSFWRNIRERPCTTFFHTLSTGRNRVRSLVASRPRTWSRFHWLPGFRDRWCWSHRWQCTWLKLNPRRCTWCLRKDSTGGGSHWETGRWHCMVACDIRQHSSLVGKLVLHFWWFATLLFGIPWPWWNTIRRTWLHRNRSTGTSWSPAEQFPASVWSYTVVGRCRCRSRRRAASMRACTIRWHVHEIVHAPGRIHLVGETSNIWKKSAITKLKPKRGLGSKMG